MLPELALPSLDAMPDPVGQLVYGGPTGTFGVEIDLVRGVGRPGAVPTLSLQYRSGAGDGVFGRGWSLSLPSISRGTGRRLPCYRDSGPEADGYTASVHGELVPLLLQRDGGWTPDVAVRDGYEVRRFRPRVERAFSRLERWRELTTGVVHWRETSRGDVTRIYGRSAECRIADPRQPLAIAQWLLEEERDPRGHVLRCVYKREDRVGVTAATPGERGREGDPPDANLHLKRVLWGNAVPGVAGRELFELVFDFGKNVEDSPTPDEVAPWALRADPRSSRRTGFELRTRRLCRRVLLFHRIDELDPEPVLVRAHRLDYDSTPERSLLIGATLTGYRDGEAAELPSLSFGYSAGLSPGPIRDVVDERAAPAADVDGTEWMDLNGVGLPGLLRRDRAGALSYRENLGGGRLAAPVTLPSRPATTEAGPAGGAMVAQPFGDAHTCVLDLESGPGYHDRDRTGRWSAFSTFASAPTSAAPAGRSIDLDGDGRADVLGAGVGAVVWQRFAGRDGWAAEEASGGAAVATLQDRSGTVLLADMTGDGLADLVQVRPGSVRYWPSLGFGRFGTVIEMAGGPTVDGPDGFDPTRVQLVDADGTGPADLLYLGRDGVSCWPNQAGNALGGRRILPGPGPLTGLDNVNVFDLTGSGAGSLVYSTPAPGRADRPTCFVDLTGGFPALVMTSVRDGAGLTTEVEYTSSTRLMVADRAAGRPWANAVPFPVPVVVQVRQTDEITGGVAVSSFGYRHGCYDDVDRELRGFAYFARRDIELPPPDPDAGRAVPPPPIREVRTWYHAGLSADGLPVLEALAAEYSRSDDPRPARPVLAVEGPPGVSSRELLRALQAKPAREEVYGLSDDAASVRPRSTTDYGYLLRALQPAQGPAAPSVAGFEREVIKRTYEQIPDDPRVDHELSLEIDPVGNVTRRVDVSYARRRPELPAQRQPQAVLTERELLNRMDDPDSWLLGVPIRERRYELAPLPPPRQELHRFGGLTGLLADPRLREVPFEAEIDPAGPPQRRLLGSTEYAYWADDLLALVPPGATGRLALPARARQAALTESLADAVYGADAAKLAAAGYEEADGLWWAPGPLVRYNADAFAQPVSTEGPARGRRRVEYDRHALLAVSTTDEVSNEEIGTPDYRSLVLAALRDANGTTRRVALDSLGLAASLISSGAMGEGPRAPTVRVERDLLAWQRSRHAPHLRVTGRASDNAEPADESVEVRMFDGRGRVLERLQAAEPDPETGTARWASSGRIIRASGDGVVRQYAPGWAALPEFRPEVELRDPVIRTSLDEQGRATAVEAPDGSRSRTIRTAWREEQWDPVDWVRDSEWERERRRPDALPDDRAAADAADALARTPAVDSVDAAGRVVEHLDDLGEGTLARTTYRLTLGGELIGVVDARGVEAEARTLDMLGNIVCVRSSASGETKTLHDVEGRAVLAWGARGQRQSLRYDTAGRLVDRAFATAAGWRVAERRVYGDEVLPPRAYSRGRLLTQFDGAGQVALEYDYRGNTITSLRTLTDPTVAADWREAAGPLLGESFATTRSYDDLTRMISRTDPDGGGVRLRFGRRGLPARVTALVGGVERDVLLSASYDAAGRLLESVLGNGVRETAVYEHTTGRLRRLTTIARDPLRDQTLTYDPVGNLLIVREAGQQRRFFNNAVASADRLFGYDAFYRLTSAQGREAAGVPPPPDAPSDPLTRPLPAPNNLAAVRQYTERYQHDLAGNLLRIEHNAPDGGSYIVRYSIAPDGDRLVGLRTDDGVPLPGRFEYDASGNALILGTLSRMQWDDDERMTQVDLIGGGTAHHAYDADGQRIHTVIVRLGGLREEWVRLDGWERWRRTSPLGEVEAQVATLHAGDGPRTVALVEQRRARDAPGTATIWRYQHTDQVGSVVLETGPGGVPLTFEEFCPYGRSAYRAAAPLVPPNRFRFHGADRDDETGLDLHGVRSYASWLGRWISPDPGGMLDGTNRYWFCRGNPASYTDPDGRQSVLRRPSAALPTFWLFGGPPINVRAVDVSDGRHCRYRLEVSSDALGRPLPSTSPFSLAAPSLGTGAPSMGNPARTASVLAQAHGPAATRNQASAQSPPSVTGGGTLAANQGTATASPGRPHLEILALLPYGASSDLPELYPLAPESPGSRRQVEASGSAAPHELTPEIHYARQREDWMPAVESYEDSGSRIENVIRANLVNTWNAVSMAINLTPRLMTELNRDIERVVHDLGGSPADLDAIQFAMPEFSLMGEMSAMRSSGWSISRVFAPAQLERAAVLEAPTLGSVPYSRVRDAWYRLLRPSGAFVEAENLSGARALYRRWVRDTPAREVGIAVHRSSGLVFVVQGRARMGEVRAQVVMDQLLEALSEEGLQATINDFDYPAHYHPRYGPAVATQYGLANTHIMAMPSGSDVGLFRNSAGSAGGRYVGHIHYGLGPGSSPFGRTDVAISLDPNSPRITVWVRRGPNRGFRAAFDSIDQVESALDDLRRGVIPLNAFRLDVPGLR